MSETNDLHTKKSIEAYYELIKLDVTYLHKADYLHWLGKYKSLKASIDDPILNTDEVQRFHFLYFHISALAKYLVVEDDAKEALHEFTRLDITNEHFLLQWLVKYEDFGLDNMAITYSTGFEDDDEVKTGYVSLHPNYNLKIAVEDYRNIYEFETIFNSYYWVMLDKYNTISDEEWYSLGSEEKEKNHKNRSSLKYHLDRGNVAYQ